VTEARARRLRRELARDACVEPSAHEQLAQADGSEAVSGFIPVRVVLDVGALDACVAERVGK